MPQTKAPKYYLQADMDWRRIHRLGIVIPGGIGVEPRLPPHGTKLDFPRYRIADVPPPISPFERAEYPFRMMNSSPPHRSFERQDITIEGIKYEFWVLEEEK